MNVHFSNEYRKYNTDLPLFLHNRPRDFVQHVSTRWTSAQDIPPGNIVQLDKRSFRVTSVDSSNTYHVSFGCNSDASMPYCECYDWKKYHWPCKHFCAIFQHVATHGWNSLAADYRDSPYFCLDSDLFQSQAGIPTTPCFRARQEFQPHQQQLLLNRLMLLMLHLLPLRKTMRSPPLGQNVHCQLVQKTVAKFFVKLPT